MEYARQGCLLTKVGLPGWDGCSCAGRLQHASPRSFERMPWAGYRCAELASAEARLLASSPLQKLLPLVCCLPAAAACCLIASSNCSGSKRCVCLQSCLRWSVHQPLLRARAPCKTYSSRCSLQHSCRARSVGCAQTAASFLSFCLLLSCRTLPATSSSSWCAAWHGATDRCDSGAPGSRHA